MALQPADFPRLLGQAESNPDWQKILRHNAAVLRAIHGGVAIALEAPVAFDPIADYWYRIERRALIAYLAERYAGRPTAAFRVVRDFALKATRHLDALRTSGEISHVGLDYRGGLRPHIAPLIRALETLPPVEGWADFVAANPKRRILPSPAQDLRVFLADLVAAKDFDEPAFNVRLPWWSYLGARSPAELRARQRFFFAYVHALTPVNSYRTAGSQFFAPVLQNTPTTHLLDALRAWRDGKDPGSHPLLGRGNNDAEHVNKSDNNIVRETWGFINLARAPQFNNQSAFLFDRPPRKEAIIPALITIGRQTRAWLDANPAERERAAQLFDRLLAEARRDAGRQEWTIFEPAVGEGDDAPVDLELSRELQGRAAADLLARPELDRAAMALHIAIDHWSFRQSAFAEVPDLSSTAADAPMLRAPAPVPEAVAPPPAAPPPPPAGPLVLRAHPRVWLYAPPGGTWEPSRDAGLAALDRDELGPLDSFADRRAIEEALAQTDVASDPVGDAAALWSFAHDIQPGDPIIARRGASQIIGIGRITSTYRFARERPTGQHVRAVEWLWTGTPVNLSDRLPLRLLTNTAGRTTLLDALQPLLTPDDPNLGPPPSPPTPYERRDLIDESFLDPARIDTMLALLRRKKNVVLQGPPGVGKTWVARRLAYLLIGARDPSRVEMVQFHPAYTYEDFIRGYRAKGKEGFVVEDGIFLRFADLARGDPDSPYVLIIDEINRGNLGKIFGELMMLIEADKRGDEWSVALAHSRRDGEERFYVPDNLYILGTMNTADRSLALVDYALRRRFAFVSVPPGFASPRFAQAWGHAPGPLEALRAALHELNRMIDADPQLGSGFQLGHSYFCDPPAAPGGADAGPLDDRLAKWLRDVYRFEILPLLEEYWFDAPDKLKQARHLLGLPGAP